ncbi:MAG: hypothetical protein HUJ99_00905 [Bacteroidaceae bacterium]|nr:hypothetical protein [Bacteroidaceae bacterium]
MKKLTKIVSLLALVLFCSSFTESELDQNDKKKAKTEKAAKARNTRSSGHKKVLVESSDTKPVWAFGFSASFTDSIVYFTDIQMLPNEKIKRKTHFMEGCSEYSNQMKFYLEDNLQLKNRTCTLFYGLKKEQAEKKYNEIRKRYAQQTHLTIKYLNSSEFQFAKPQTE